ncbi:hypothetical protein HB984_14915, partial [Listeria seeligeri]|nr:hypothetical protein [Listeria seeligeri]
IFTMLYGIKPIALDKDIKNHYLVNQSYAYQQVQVNSKQTVSQTFEVEDPFSHIGIYVLKKPSENNKYRIKITNKNDGKIISDDVYNGSSFTENQYFPVNVSGNPKDKTNYSIQIISEEGNDSNSLAIGTYQKNNVDLYAGGAMYVNGKNQPYQDIGFTVIEQTEAPFIPWYKYALIIIGFIGIASTIFLTFKRKNHSEGKDPNIANS